MQFENWASDEIQLARSAVALKIPTPNSSMYKYISLDGKQSWNYFDRMLGENKLYGSTLKSLNDPFEGSPYLIDDLSPSLIKRTIANNFDLAFRKHTGKPLPNFDDVETYRSEAINYLIKMLADYRVLAFCNRSDSPLLWSHYANSYKGACLHFLGRSFRKIGFPRAKLGYVAYSDHRPNLPLSLALSMVQKDVRNNKSFVMNRAELEKFCFFSKGLDWRYENEIRAIYSANETTNLEFHSDGLVSITLGPRMEQKEKDKLIKKVRNSKFKDIQIMDAKLSKNTFSVNSVYDDRWEQLT